ncbi:HSP20-like chaperone [Phycomyces blakesleeanus]|uniref:CS domain-containing protein n=2 Tax=Phycomyces blakesleeanus TaxID=4837 RepID=A0A163CXL3_PHYB8|nr:hypothetical protein PHYBLDRAFT_183927 [Phycomyces blakesleeanus NRRL 1555(-)]OAD66340.1 hypothetical protein PHYBLDRAFT_183927 [Phycomyces blakesleeanus NRRL 1555(-)]|eukprot:XP_018284380.1 hypothetical protein PHYBLDRAFT_183927 [Phycomyces blakesleeanus NRRL 1555(-)]
MPLHPTVLWAQRNDLLYLTVELSDIKTPQINIQPTKFSFKGKGEKEQNEYEAEIEFFGEIDVEKSKQHLTPRNLLLVLYKKEEGFWPRLQKGSKLNFVKVDFTRWKDEDDDEEEEPAMPAGMEGMGGMGGGMEGMGGMGGMDFSSLLAQAGAGGQMGGMDNLPEDDEDSSDEEEAPKK